MSNCDYEIEKLFSKYGGEADKGITRICGNCHLYNAYLWTCEHAENAEDASIYEENKTGCYYHRAHKENERLQELISKRQDKANRLRLEEQRRNGTSECTGCPFREMQSILEQLVEAVKTLNAISLIKIKDKLIEDAVNIIKKAKGEE